MTLSWNAVFFALVLACLCSSSIALAQSDPTYQANRDFFVKRDCNSSNCHGNTVDNALLWNKSGEIWFQQDPHANAYAVLLNADSQQIVKALWDPAKAFPEKTQDPAYHEFLEARCASCHASELAPKTQRIQGVDCQACHGSAIHWDASHFSTSWKALGKARFKDPSAHGRVNTESVWQVAQVCGSCHIGHLGRTGQVRFNDQSSIPLGQQEVSHQLMAAGHPPTYFELSNFLRRYPKHWWDEANVAAANAKPNVQATSAKNFTAQSLDTWRIGKLVNAKQRLELLKNRLDQPEWPEFTEHRCTSCHHPIDSYTKKIAPASQAFAEWDGWYLEQIDLALAITQFPQTPIRLDPSEPQADPFDHTSVQSWVNHHSSLKKLLLDPTANHPTGQSTEIGIQVEAMLKLLEPILLYEYPIVETANIPAIQVAWKAKLSALFAQDHSWESAVQWKLAAQALSEVESPSRVVLPSKSDDWDLPLDMWTRTQQMPYQASRFFDPEDFQKQLLDIIDSLKR